MVEPRPSLGILGILREAFKITIRNGKFMVSILLPVLLSFSLLVLGAHLAFTPVLKHLTSEVALLNEYPNGSEVGETIRKGMIKDVRHFLLLELVHLVLVCVILLNFLVATVSFSSDAYTGKKLNLKDLLLRLRGRWQNPIVTSFYMTLMSLSVMALFLILIGFISVMTEGFSLILLMFVMVILGTFCYVYVTSIWMLSLVVSVVEDDSRGLKAIDRAGELMKGKRLRGCALILVLTLISAAIYGTFSIMTKKENWTAMVIGIPRIWLLCVVKLFMFVVYTVFYHECKKSQAEDDQLACYAPVVLGEA